MSVEIRPVLSRRERRHFRDAPSALYGKDPCFVPQLDAALHAVLDRRRNPFWRHAVGCEWIAVRRGHLLGRVGACRDEALLARAPGTGVVGFLDCADDAEVAARLFATAEDWLRAQGCTRGRGPLNYSMNDTAGVLVEGFDTPPTVDTTWNPPFVPRLWEAAQWKGAKDMLACAGDLIQGGPERVHKFGELARQRGVTVRTPDLRRFAEESEILRRVFNEAWEGNWGHVPIDADEFAFKAKDLKAVVDPALLRIAELDGEPIGIYFGLPDLNVAIRRCRGRLFPFGWFHLLRAKKVCPRNRVILLGVLPGRRIRGVETLMLSDSYPAWIGRYTWSEASWVLADNKAMLNGLALHNLHPYKRWRVYEKELVAPRGGV